MAAPSLHLQRKTGSVAAAADAGGAEVGVGTVRVVGAADRRGEQAASKIPDPASTEGQGNRREDGAIRQEAKMAHH